MIDLLDEHVINNPTSSFHLYFSFVNIDIFKRKNTIKKKNTLKGKYK